MSKPNPFHVQKCFLAVISYNSPCAVLEIVQDGTWCPVGKFFARLNKNGFVEVAMEQKENIGTFIGVEGANVSFPRTASLPNLLHVFMVKDDAQMWIDSFRKN